MKTATKSHWSRKLQAIGACADAVQWAKDQPSFAKAWTTCKRGDWMLWLAGKRAGDQWDAPGRRALALAAARCARLALPIFEKRYPDDKRVRECLDLVERFGRGEIVTREELRKARAADAAADAAADRIKILSQCSDIVRGCVERPVL